MTIALQNKWKNFKAVCFGVFLGLLLCEIILRIYNPFPFSIKKGRLILPANQSKVFENKWISKLDKQIHYSRNSLGFRGPEAPDTLNRMTSIITVGGSTTECKFLSDSTTWPFLLYLQLKSENSLIWLNNAGVDGHSTFGHLLLQKEYLLKLKPNYVLFMTGINDEEVEKPEAFDLMTEKKVNTSSVKGFIKSLLNYSELGRTAFNYYHVQIAYKKGLIHKQINIKDLVSNPQPDSVVAEQIKRQFPYLTAYHDRIDQLVNNCLQAGITPVLITQPSMFGDFTDSTTNVAMADKWTDKTEPFNCLLEQRKLELYNDILRSYADKIEVIDLAKEMPKNSLYYYDFIHFTNEGAAMVSKILFSHLSPAIANKH